jgi:type III pantothenate kinase
MGPARAHPALTRERKGVKQGWLAGIVCVMDINLMVVNVGNSRLAMGVIVAGNLTYVSRTPHAQRADWGGKIAEAWRHLAETPGAEVAGAGVNPELVEPLERVVMEQTGRPVQWVGREIDLPVRVLTEQPGQTGADRVLNIAAAYEQMQKACVVVDAGTAITVDVCNEKGEFVGGAISPGLEMMLAALHEKTAGLPRVEAAVPVEPFGRSTAEAMRHGVYHGVRGMVKELVENYATELGDWPEIIATGGDAPLLFEGWELIHAIAPDLTLYGIALAYTNHHIKHGT